MAYGTYLASVSEEQVSRLWADPSHKLVPDRVVMVSHLIAYWVQLQPLGGLLGEAIDGGRLLSDALWHPLQSPTYHPPDGVKALLATLSDAWDQAIAQHPFSADDWYRIEIETVLDIFKDAASRGNGVAKLLQPPMDAERASRVVIPLEGVHDGDSWE